MREHVAVKTSVHTVLAGSLWHILFIDQLVAHAVLDVVVDDEVQLLVREAVVLRQDFVYFVDDG